MYLQLIKKFCLYGGGSVIALAADIGMLSFLHYVLSKSALWSAGIAFVFGCIVKYIVSERIVYEDNRQGSHTTSIVIYMVIALSALLTNHVIIYLGVNVFDMNLLLSKTISAGVVFISNFFLLGFFVFKDDLGIKITPNKKP